ncbi:MAG: hypothetical protein R3B54_19230 [Bdellovibrionota bacterium]
MTPDALWKTAPASVLTTGIGSLPHPYVDAALQFSFQMSVPFLPQLPVRNPKEFMIGQALDRLPGLYLEEGGVAKVRLSDWEKGAAKLRDSMEKALASKEADAFDSFLPDADSWSAWTPFLFELEERSIGFAKVHLAGPLTCQWALQLEDGTPAYKRPEIGMQVYKLTLARAIGMIRKLRSLGITPLFYVDEPGFYGFTKANPTHVTGLSELKLFIQSLQKEKALVGLHCCSNTDWKAVLGLPLDVLSFDTHLSLDAILTQKEAVQAFLGRGGRFSFGVVPTAVHSVKIMSYTPELLVDTFLDSVRKHYPEGTPSALLKQCLITPACGLALHRIEDAETILTYTLECAKIINTL